MSAIDQFNHLTPAAQYLTRHAARPQIVAVAGICILVGLGASILGFASIDRETDSLLTIFSKTLCGPGGLSGNASATFLLSAAIWTSMTIVMMLPGAAPMLLTYGEIAETAAEKGVAAVSPLILTGGYLTVWGAFAVFAAAIETLFMRNFPSLEISTQTYLAGASLLLAGAYQFSSLKHACLTRCRRPFAFFFANWTDKDGRRLPSRPAAGIVLFGMLLGPHAYDACARLDEFNMDDCARNCYGV